MEQFQKDDLHNNDIVILKNNDACMLFNRNGELCLESEDYQRMLKLSDYNDKLENNHEEYHIVKIKRPTQLTDFVRGYWRKVPTIWARRPILSESEYHILKNVDPIYKFITRDKHKQLYLYKKMPEKAENIWNTDSKSNFRLEIYEHIFEFIKWEDDEPYLIQDLVKDYKDYKDNK